MSVTTQNFNFWCQITPCYSIRNEEQMKVNVIFTFTTDKEEEEQLITINKE